MKHLFGLSDIRAAYRLRNLSNVQAWRQHPTFPAPTACYGTTHRPLFDPAEVASWVAEHRPEIARAAGEVRA